MIDSHQTTRRDFIKRCAGGAVAAPLVGSLAGCITTGGSAVCSYRPEHLVPRDRKMNIAAVGIGGKGYTDIKGCADEHIVALCDVDAEYAKRTFDEYPDAKRYTDFRKMYEEMGDEIDGVIISTPDHMHYLPALMAIQRGKHVYVQKPLTHTVEEARRLRSAAREHKVVTQMGNQGHAGEGCRLLKEWIDAGAIGAVREVYVWTNKLDREKHAKYRTLLTKRPEGMPVPDTLDWNGWLGVATERDYSTEYHPRRWRSWWEFGCGVLGDIGCHTMDGAFYALELGAPSTVEAKTSPFTVEVAPDSSIVTYQFPARGQHPPVTLYWYDGEEMPERPTQLEADRKMPGVGSMYVGDKGVILDSTEKIQSPRLIPEQAMKDFLPNRPPKTIPRVPKGDPYLEWIEACKGGPMCGSNFDYAGPLTEMVLLGNVAIRAGKKIEWNAETMSCVNAPEANKYLKKPYRAF